MAKTVKQIIQRDIIYCLVGFVDFFCIITIHPLILLDVVTMSIVVFGIKSLTI